MRLRDILFIFHPAELNTHQGPTKMAECNKIESSASIENSDHKTDNVVNKKEKSSFLFYSENNFTWKGDLKSLKAFVATILICDDAKWSSPRAEEKLFKTAEFSYLKMARSEEREAADHEG